MNIILRPGGGDRAKALPRPKVEVNSEGSNVILVRLTFPENENIQGLRAFTPTDPKDLERFAELRESIAADAIVERISAISSEEIEQKGTVSIFNKQQRASLSEEKLSQPMRRIVSNPTRPPRPSKLRKQSFGHFGGTTNSISKTSLSNIPQSKGPLFTIPPRGPKSFTAFNNNAESSVEIINMLDRNIENKVNNEFQFVQFTDSEENVASSRIRPRQPQDPPPSGSERVLYKAGEVEPFLAYEAMEERDRLSLSDKLLSSQPDMSNEIEYSDTQHSKTVKTTPTRPSRPAKLQRPPGAPPRPQGPQEPPGPQGPQGPQGPPGAGPAQLPGPPGPADQLTSRP